MLTGSTFSIIVIILSLVLFVFLSMKGLSPIPTALICALLVACTTTAGVYEAMFTNFLGGVTTMVANSFLIFTMGGLMGAVMNATGASEVLGKTLVRKLGVRWAPYSILILSFILTMGAIGGGVFLIAYLSFAILKAANLPRNIGLIAMSIPLSPVAFCMPGVGHISNVLRSAALGTTLFAAPGIGITCVVIGTVLGIIYMEWLIRYYRKNNIGYDPRQIESQLPERKPEESPSFFCSLLPIVVIIVLIFVLQLGFGWESSPTVILSQLIGIILMYILNGKYIKENKFQMISSGISNILPPLIGTSAIVGYASVVTLTSGYTSVMSSLTTLNMNPYILTFISISVICALCADSVGGLSAFLTTIAPGLLAQGVSPQGLHIVSGATATVFDSLPHNGVLNMNIQVFELNLAKAYKHMVALQLVIPFIYSIVAVVLAIIFY